MSRPWTNNMQYEFVHRYRQFAPGDAVPATWGRGLILSFLERHRIRESDDEKPLDTPPRNKAIKRKKVRRKARDANPKQ